MERIEKLTAFLKKSPQDSFLQHALALEYVKLGDDEKAKNLFEAILATDAGYIGTYYHLGKLLERTGNQPQAIETYQKGMVEAKKAGDNHTFNELQAAYEDLVF